MDERDMVEVEKGPKLQCLRLSQYHFLSNSCITFKQIGME